MNAKRSAIVLGVALMAGFFSTAQSTEFFTDQGSIWTGGSFSYMSYYSRSEKNPENMLNISPVIRFFPGKYLLLSPAFSWQTSSYTYSYSGLGSSSFSSGTFAIGPEVGFAYGNNIPVIPYFYSGVKYAHSSSSTTSSGLTTTSGADGYNIPLYTGIMIPLVDGLGIQVETGFAYSHMRNYTTSLNNTSDYSIFSISLGVCGIGRKTAISILTGIL